jgi:hypothetical protein
MVTSFIFGAVGVFLLFNGLTADYLIDESEGAASEEMKADSPATPLKRVVVVSAGLFSIAWSIFHATRAIHLH